LVSGLGVHSQERLLVTRFSEGFNAMPKRHWSLSALIAGFVLAFALFAASGADAQNTKKQSAGATALITGSSFDAIVAALESNGFSVELTTDSDGDPLIVSNDDEMPFSIYFYACVDGMDCEFIQFVSGWHIDGGTASETIAEWNADRVWGRAYLDSDNDPWIDLAVSLKGGVSAENFNDTVIWWLAVMDDFEDHIGFEQGDPG
jgi:hypothetical protein